MAFVSPKAVCYVSPDGKPSKGETVACEGNITITKISEEEVEIEWDITGLTPGEHGFHIHEKADFSKSTSVGPIYNPHGKAHGAPGDSERHVGSLGNIVADASSRSKGKMKDALVKIDGPFSVVGRSFTVHAEPDDLGKTKAGGVGARVACGQIKEPPPLSQAELMELHMAELKANQLKHQKLMGKMFMVIFLGGLFYAKFLKGLDVPPLDEVIAMSGPGLAAFVGSLVALAFLTKMMKSLWNAAMTPQEPPKDKQS